MWGADPVQYFAAAGLHSRAVDSAPDRWQLQTQERYRHIRPSLITVDHLAGPVEPLQVLPSQGAQETSPVPTLPAAAAEQALHWWTDRLSHLFAVLTDPAVFTDRQQSYQPAKHLHALLTVEQLFRRVASIQTAHRDTNARRVLLFSVLDTLERLTGHSVDTLCSLPFARARLEAVTGTLGPDAGTILLPAAQQAIRALQQVQDGFYLRKQLRTETIELPTAGAPTRPLSPDRAAAEYIKVLRNATRGHGSNRASRAELTNTLPAHHDGTLPHDLALLGYLYLLDVLAHPDVVHQQLYRGGTA